MCTHKVIFECLSRRWYRIGQSMCYIGRIVENKWCPSISRAAIRSYIGLGLRLIGDGEGGDGGDCLYTELYDWDSIYTFTCVYSVTLCGRFFMVSFYMYVSLL